MTLPRQPLADFQQPFRSIFGFAPAPVAASGTITCVTNANMADTDYITIGDGLTAAKLYEYDKSANGVTATRVSWTAGASTAADVAATLKTAINANQPSLLVTDNLDGTLSIAHAIPGVVGNVTITENVANAGFLVTGMSGGLASGVPSTITYTFETLDFATRIDSVEILNPTGFAQHASNYWTLTLKHGSTTIASWSTLTGAEGTITADVAAVMTLSATDANRIGASGALLKLTLTKTGSPAAFPPGRIVIHGRQVA